MKDFYNNCLLTLAVLAGFVVFVINVSEYEKVEKQSDNEVVKECLDKGHDPVECRLL